jgi:hypothetical protein
MESGGKRSKELSVALENSAPQTGRSSREIGTQIPEINLSPFPLGHYFSLNSWSKVDTRLLARSSQLTRNPPPEKRRQVRQ